MKKDLPDEAIVAPYLNQICPYYTMFPSDVARRAISNFAPAGLVMDPFCGRGTTLHAARQLACPSAGIDSDAVAVAVARAKGVKTTPSKVVSLAERLLADTDDAPELPSGQFWDFAYHKSVLRQLVQLRHDLLQPRIRRTNAGIALTALLLGALHGPLRKNEHWHLSNQMPRTFAPKPRYSIDYWRQHKLSPPEIDVVDVIERRAAKYFESTNVGPSLTVIHDDARLAYLGNLDDNISAIVTSPPYYGMNSYGPDQWLRRWFIGGPDSPRWQTDGQIRHQNAEIFAHDLSLVWRNLTSVCEPNARMLVRFGGVAKRHVCPDKLIKQSFSMASDVGWRLVTSKPAGAPSRQRRQATQFRSDSSKYVNERDYYLILEG